MIYLQLFLTFLEIGAVSFGGGYGMISLIRERVMTYGWLTEEQVLNMIAISESTPGPIAVNMATYVGATQGGLPGSVLATLGVILPAFLIILIILLIVRHFMEYAGVKAFLSGVRPCVIGLILSTAAILFLSNLLGITTLVPGVTFAPDLRALLILGILLLVVFVFKKTRRKKPSSIMLILISACLGMIVYSIG